MVNFFELGRRIKEDVHFICYERSVGQRKHLSPPLGFEPQTLRFPVHQLSNRELVQLESWVVVICNQYIYFLLLSFCFYRN